MRVKAWVRQSFAELGDHADKSAPIREVVVVGYDGGRYADVIVCGQRARCDFGSLALRPESVEPAPKPKPKDKTPAMAKAPADFQTTYSRIRAMQDNPRDSIHARVKGMKAAAPAE